MVVIATQSLEQLCCGNKVLAFQSISHRSLSDTTAIPALPSKARPRATIRSWRSAGDGTRAGIGGGFGRAAGTPGWTAAEAPTWVRAAQASANPQRLQVDVMTPLLPELRTDSSRLAQDS